MTLAKKKLKIELRSQMDEFNYNLINLTDHVSTPSTMTIDIFPVLWLTKMALEANTDLVSVLNLRPWPWSQILSSGLSNCKNQVRDPMKWYRL